jgi:hypothetical protein
MFDILNRKSHFNQSKTDGQTSAHGNNVNANNAVNIHANGGVVNNAANGGANDTINDAVNKNETGNSTRDQSHDSNPFIFSLDKHDAGMIDAKKVFIKVISNPDSLESFKQVLDLQVDKYAVLAFKIFAFFESKLKQLISHCLD